MDMVDAVLTQQFAPQDPQTPGQQATQSPQQPDGVDAILDAASNIKQLDPDPAYQSMQLHTAAMESRGESVSDQQKLAILQAYKSLYGQRPMVAEGGNAAMRDTLQAQAAGNSAAGNFARAVANAFAQTGANVLGIVAPGTANKLAQKAQEEYNPDQTTMAAKAGGLAGNITATLPAVLAPGAAVPAFAGLGFGEANREVSNANANGASIGVGQRLTYDATTAAIQGLVAHFLGKMTGGGILQKPGSAATQTIPFQSLIRQISPDLLESIQGTDGAVIRPIIQRTLLNMGVGAGQNEVAMIAQEIARSAEGIVQPGEKDLVDRVLSQTPETLASGAAQALPFALHGELGQSGELNRGEVERVPQENIQDLGKAGSSPRVVRYASEENPFLDEPQTPPATPTPETPAPEDAEYYDREADENTRDVPPVEGQMLPPDERLSQDPDFMQSLADQQRQIRESDELLARVNNGAGPAEGNGRLPNDAYAQAEHPLVQMLQTVDPSVHTAPSVPEAYAADFAALKEHGITAVPVVGENAPAGFSSAEHPDAVAIDVSTPDKARASIQNVVAHEAAHVWQDLHPTKVDRMYRLIPEAIRAKYQEWYFKALAKQRGTAYAQEYMAKYKKAETISMAFGDAASKYELVQRAFQKDQSLWGTIKDAFARAINTFTGKGRMLNAVADEMRRGLGLVSSGQEAHTEIGGRAYMPAASADAQRWLSEKWAGGKENLSEEIGASKPVYHETSVNGARSLLGRILQGPRNHLPFYVSDSRDLALGQGGKGVLLDFDSDRVNGGKPNSLANQTLAATKQGVGEYTIDKTLRTSVRALEFASPRQLDAMRRTPGLDKIFNFDNPIKTDYGLRVERNTPSATTAVSEGQMAPKNYLEVGHGKHDNEEIWWQNDEGDIKRSKTALVHAAVPEAMTAEFRGRIDHTAKEVSVTGDNGAEFDDRSLINTAKRLQKRFPDYTVYVDTKGGLSPLEDVMTHGRFMLSKLDNIAKDEDDVKAYKAALNAASPANAIRFETTAEDKVKRAVFDNQAPLVNMIRTAMARVNDPAKLSPEAYLRRMAGFRERRYQQEKVGLRSLTGEEILDKQTGENLTRNWLVQPLVDSAKRTGEKIEDVKAYAQSIMVAQRTLEKASQTVGSGKNLDDAISGIGQARAHGTAGEKDVDEAIEFLKKAKTEPAFKDAMEYARRMRQWGNEHMRMAVESGLISREQARAMLSENKFYVNMQRVLSDHRVLGDADFADGQYHKFRGSNRLIDDPLANTLQTTEQIAKKAEANFVKRKIVELARPFGDMIQPAKTPGIDTITVKENGKDAFYYVDPQVASVINGWGKNTPPALWGVLSMPGRLKMLGTLLRPMFRWNHFRKQFQNRLLISEEAGGFKGIAATIKGFDPDTKELLDVLGGTMSHERDYGSTSDAYYKQVSKMLDKVAGNKNSLLALPKKVWDGYQTLGEWSDAFNRVVEFKQALANAKRRGMNDLDAQTYAAWKARDLMDFSVAGDVVKQVNRIAYQPFMNAEIQGLRKMYELARTNPTLAAQRLALFGLGPAMLPFLWAKSQGKDVEAKYKDTPLAQRIMFYQFPIGDYQIMVPKGQTQAMASALWEAFLDKHNGDVHTWAKAMGDSGLVPRQLMDPESLLPFQGVREAISNYSWFYDRHIIPPDQEGLALDLRHTDGASGVAQRISEVAKHAGWEIDPRKIDHVLANDFGTTGIDVEAASNIGRANKPLAATAMAGYADVRLPPGYTAQSVQDAMTAAQRYRDSSSPQYQQMQDALSASYKATTVAERNRLVDQARAAADQANAFYQRHGDELLAVKKATQTLDEAVAESAKVQGVDARRAWAEANPQKLQLVRDQGRLDLLQKRISEIRKALVNPRLSDATKAAADRDLSRLFGVIVKMVSDAKSVTKE